MWRATSVLIFILQVDNKADTHVLWFSVRKKIEKKFPCFCVNKFFDVIRIRKKFFLTCQKNVFGISKEKIQKKGFFILFLSRNRIRFYFEWQKNWKNKCRIHHSSKNIFGCQMKVVKKNDMSGIKRYCWKKMIMLKMKKWFSFTKNVCLNKRWSR